MEIKHDKNKIYKFILLGAYILGIFYLYNFININGGNWFLHPDERDGYTIAENLYENHSFSIPIEFSNNIGFMPEGSVMRDGYILPGRSLGIYLLLAPSFLISAHASFYVIPLMGIIALIFLFLILVKTTSIKVASYSVVIFSITPQFIYWNNMLYSNIPSISMFLVGAYLMLYKDKKFFLSTLFFSFAIYLRYE